MAPRRKTAVILTEATPSINQGKNTRVLQPSNSSTRKPRQPRLSTSTKKKAATPKKKRTSKSSLQSSATTGTPAGNEDQIDNVQLTNPIAHATAGRRASNNSASATTNGESLQEDNTSSEPVTTSASSNPHATLRNSESGTANYNPLNVSTNMSGIENPLLLFSAALTETLRTVREAAQSESDSRFGGRIEAAKKLPEFSGNPLDWVHFLESYRTSTNLCGFSERENIGRLHVALRGRARDSVRTLFATATKAEKIIETLELNFGDKYVVAAKLVRDMRDIPKLASKELNLAQFADRLHNSLLALKSIEMEGLLQNPELLQNVASKLPEGLKFAYYRHTSELPESASRLEKLVEFLRKEAQLAREKGMFDLEPIAFERARDARNNDTRKNPKSSKRAEIYAVSKATPRKRSRDETERCAFCHKPNHEIIDCRQFGRESSRNRWEKIKKMGLCFICLSDQHYSRDCKEKTVCDYCNGNHNNLLHFFKRSRGEEERRTSAEGDNPRSNETDNSRNPKA